MNKTERPLSPEEYAELANSKGNLREGKGNDSNVASEAIKVVCRIVS